jgi:peptidyl-prolyl cis-trans isomerase D
LADLSNLAFETGDLQTISEQLNLVILESPKVPRSGGSGLFANSEVLAAAFSDEVLLEGNNSDVIELGASQAMVLRVEQFNPASISPLEEVQPEIAVLLRTQMERDAVQALGDQILTASEAGDDIQPLLDANELTWVETGAVRRSANTVNREILEKAFSMPTPQAGPELDSITLGNGTFVLIALERVIPGSIEALSDAERTNLTQSMLADLGNSDFDAFLNNLRNKADITTRLSATDEI